MREIFRPEFLNRIDEIVEFDPLTREQIGEIVELQLRAAARRGSPSAGLSLELTDDGEGARSPRPAGIRPTARGR